MLGYDWCEVHTLMRQPDWCEIHTLMWQSDWCEIHTTLYALKKKEKKNLEKAAPRPFSSESGNLYIVADTSSVGS